MRSNDINSLAPAAEYAAEPPFAWGLPARDVVATVQAADCAPDFTGKKLSFRARALTIFALGVAAWVLLGLAIVPFI